jgi:site-specific DNA-methyltransferase (adenine-specific)
MPVVVEPRSKPGDLWLLGEHRVLCGDATSAEDVGALMASELAACMWTDPPYGVSIVGGYRRLSSSQRIAERPDSSTIMGDTPGALPDLLLGAFAGAPLEPGSPWYCARPAGAPSFLFADAIRKLGWHLHEELQWVKGTMVLGHSDYHLRHETIMYGWTPGEGRSGRGSHAGSRWYGDNAQTSVFEIPLRPSPDHPSMKPVELVTAHIGNSARPGGLVYDPFLGSGTTVIACEQLGRRCYGLEIEPHYVDVIVARWEAFTGKPATRVEAGVAQAEAKLAAMGLGKVTL